MSVAAETVDINNISAACMKQVSDTFLCSFIQSAVNFGSSFDFMIVPVGEQDDGNICINDLIGDKDDMVCFLPFQDARNEIGAITQPVDRL